MGAASERLEAHFLRRPGGARLQLDALDGLRGIAVLLVVLSHLSNGWLYLAPGLDFSGSGKYGVYLFFALSAFLLTLPLVSSGGPPLADSSLWLRYAVRRLLRIYPLYALVLFVDFAATQLGPHPAFESMSLDSLRAHLLLQEGVGLYWTIPVEFSYYAVLPFVAAVYVTLLRRNLAAVTLATVAAIAAALGLWPPSQAARDTLQLGPYLPIFLCGSYAAFLHARLGDPTLASIRQTVVFRGIGLGACLALIGLIPAVASGLGGHVLEKSHFHREFLLFGLLWSAMILALLRGGGWPERLLSSLWLRIVGVVSFSVYLWHMQLLKWLVLQRWDAPTLLAWGGLALSIGVACLSWSLVEAPFTRGAIARRALAAVARRRPQASAPADG